MRHDQRNVVIVGSGPAGAAAASFLSREGVETTVLDAGPERRARGLTVRIKGFTVASVGRRELEMRPGVTMAGDARAKVYEDLSPGGLTNHWSCAVPRFSRQDFADAVRAGERYAWPLDYDELAPWYDRVEPLLHVAGPTISDRQLPAGRVVHGLSLPDDWKRVQGEARSDGRGVLPLPYAYGADTSVTFSGTVFNTFVRLVRPAERRGKLTVIHDARVLRLEYSKESGRVEGVVYRNGLTGNEELVRCRAVILAAGSINSTQILLQSASPDFPEGLGNTHGVLGRYLHDHPLGKLIVDLGEPVSVYPTSYVTRPALERAEPLYAAAFAQWGGTRMVAESVLRRHPRRLSWVGFNVFGTMAPTEDNRVKLDPDRKDTSGASGLVLDIRHPPESARLMKESLEQMLDLLDRARLKPRLRHWHVEDVGVAHHYGGSCRMHENPEFGMLDRWSRLHAVKNVVVADSAAFTTGPEKNPVLTAMALSARASDRLMQDLRTGDA